MCCELFFIFSNPNNIHQIFYINRDFIMFLLQSILNELQFYDIPQFTTIFKECSPFNRNFHFNFYYSHEFFSKVLTEILCHGKFPPVPRTLLSILTDFNSAVVLMISVDALISNSPCCFSNSMGTVLSAHATVFITFTVMFHSFFVFLSFFFF